MSSRLISDSFTNRTKILNLNTSIPIKDLNFSRYYIGNFNVHKLNNDGTFNIQESNNRVIEVFTEPNMNIIGYFFRGIYDENSKTIINTPKKDIQNIIDVLDK